MRRGSRLLWLIASLLGAGALSFALPYPGSSYAAAEGQSGSAAPAPTAQSAGDAGQGGIKEDTPPVPVEEIIRRFAQHESDFKIARDQYTYTQDVLIQEAEPDGGEFHLVSDIVFTPAGKRYEEVTYAPQPTLNHIILSPEDMRDLENIQPFVLTTEDLPKYDVEYEGSERIDELRTYVFRVGPKRIEKNQRYFQGTVWVDDHDFAVVKSDGKAVPDVIKGNSQNLFPRFVTYRENIEANFWFPTYTHADDILRFSNGDVHILMTVRYKKYKRFGSTIRIGESKPLPTPPANSPAPQK